MKQASFLIIAAAAFVGVMGALQIDRWLHRPVELAEPKGGMGAVMPIEFDTSSPAGADFRAPAHRVLPSVVAVDRFDAFERFGDGQQVVQETGQGSGVIVNEDGTIVTNNHVVSGAAAVRVRLSDKRTFRAKVVGTDPRSDLAVLKIDAPDLKPIDLGDSSKIEVGQWVIAVGNPLGYAGTVSVGVVSSLGRNLMAASGRQASYLVDAIQTDAAINAGNSGGALADAQGRLIGINSAIASTSGGSIGIGFAIPVNRVRRVVNDILKLGYARHGGLGVRFEPRYDGVLALERARQSLAEIAGATPPDHGIIVEDVDGGGSAEQAGVGRYDVLLALDGQALDDSLVLNQLLSSRLP
ncbi:MAG: trypsin-like peptidase domain-containing protein, partial [Fimbriimonas ginsengisoli]|nr:trypsin-like peptidase domain-containing protein [Fimbriimonas ginsengisoli]